jgi:uncharacterized repeat protein (TIGR01451 family)
VAFYSCATNLNPADTDLSSDVYVKDLLTGEIVLASTSDTGIKAIGGSVDASLSADGTMVAFHTQANNLDAADPDHVQDVYVKNLLTGDLVLASTSDTGIKGDGSSGHPTLSANGTVVSFYSLAANLDASDTDSVRDIYVKNLLTGDLVLASTSDTGIKGNGDSSEAILSADGTAVAFPSVATNLDPSDTDIHDDVYVKSLLTGDLVLASTTDTGIKGNAASREPTLSLDGTMVAFDSLATNLVLEDPDSLTDVYVKNLLTGDLVLASTSDGGTKGNGGQPALSADGTKVAFSSSATNLDPADTDDLPDVYLKEPGGPSPHEADVGVRTGDKPDPVVVGSPLRYGIAITNHGPGVALGVTLTDTFPRGTVFVSVSASQGSCAVNMKQRMVTCDLGGLAGVSATVRLVVSPQRTGTITNTASVSADEPDSDLANNSDSESTLVV